ncbi:MAG: hypothetical protein AB1756_07240 [Acidobacteriota bacterium]
MDERRIESLMSKDVPEFQRMLWICSDPLEEDRIIERLKYRDVKDRAWWHIDLKHPIDIGESSADFKVIQVNRNSYTGIRKDVGVVGSTRIEFD